MKLEFAYGQVRVHCSGLEQLKLKAEITKRIGSLLQSDKGILVFPVSCLPALEGLFPESSLEEDVSKNVLSSYRRHADARATALGILDRKDTTVIPQYWKQKLDPEQSVAVAAMVQMGLLGLCLFDEQGSGKTVMTIAAFDILKERDMVDAMIVACPKSVLGAWDKDISALAADKFAVITAMGDRQEKYNASMKDFDVLITTYEGIEPMQVVLKASAQKTRYLLVIDESFYAKNPASLRSDILTDLRAQCSCCFMLCGTPAPNSAYDLINQFDLADLGFTFGTFRKGRDADADRDRIADLVESKGMFIRRLKTDILSDVPDKHFHVIRVPLIGKQAMIYEEARSALELELRSLDNTSFKRKLATYFQRRAALLQICSSPASIDPTFTDIPVKYSRLDGLLNDLIKARRKVIIWSFFKSSLDELAIRYAHYEPVRIDGSVSAENRKTAIRLFQEDPSKMLFIGNPAAAGAGITLHASYDAIYVSYSNQAAHYLQSLDRIHRRGQKSKAVNYYLLVCENTIEETEVLRLRGKELQQHSILGDNVPWPTSLDEALKELSNIKVG